MSHSQAVLVVDDDAQFHNLLRPALSEKGLSVESAFTPDEAAEKLAQHSFDLVLLSMSGQNAKALALLKQTRANGARPKVIVMTAANATENLVCALRERAVAYISKPASTHAVVDAVIKALHTPSNPDDIIVISAKPDWISLIVSCRLETGERLAQFFRGMNMGLSPRRQEEVVMAFRELLINSIEHGGHLDPAKRVRLSYIRSSRAIIYHIHDPGEGFSMDDLSHAAISNQPDKPIGHSAIREQKGMRPGGFGILLSRELADDVIYNEKGNEVLLIKYL